MTSKTYSVSELKIILAFILATVVMFPYQSLAYNKSWDQGHQSTNPNDGDEGCEDEDECGPKECSPDSTACPVYVKTGRLEQTFTDLSVPGIGPSLTITRTYQSLDWANSLFGRHWVFNFGRRIAILRSTEGDKRVLVHGQGGEINSFNEHEDGTLELLNSYDVTYDLMKNPDSTYTIAWKAGTVEHIGRDGKLLRIIDRNGNELSFTYNSVGCLSRITNASGNYIDFQLGPNGKVASISDNLGRTVAYGYDTNANLTSSTDPMGNMTQYAYDNYNRLTSIIDPRGNTVLTVTYDSFQPPRIQTFSEKGETWTFTYYNGYTVKRDSSGNSWTYYYNDLGLTERTIDPLGNVTRKQHNQVTSTSIDWEDDANGNRTTYTYDADGNTTSVTDPLGNTWQYTYVAGTDRMETETNPLGVVTRYEYNSDGNLIRLIRDFGGSLENTTTYAYDAEGNLTSITDPLGNTTTYEYDSNGNLIKITYPLGNVTTYTYDSRGNRLTETDALGNTTAYTYNLMGRLLSITDALGNTTTYSYDSNGNRTTETDADGNTTTYAYDAYNRLNQITDPLGNNTSYTYDSRDNRISMTDNNGNTTTYTYDALNHLTRETNALGEQTNFTYDAIGNLGTKRDPLGRTTSFTYDGNNRLLRTVFPDSASSENEYDAMGRVISEIDELGQRTDFSFDVLGRLTQRTNALDQVSSFAYDAANNLITETNVRGLVSHYTYDAMGKRLTSTNPMGETEQRTYDALNRVATTIDSVGVQINYQYDALGRLIQQVRSDGATYQKEYSATGLLTADIDPLGRRTEYVYDVLGRQIRVRNPDGSETITTYDGNGNVMNVTDAQGNVITYSYDQLNRPFSRMDALGASETYQYDAAGNLIRLTDRLGRAIIYAYDQRDRRISETWDSGHVISSSYDAVGNVLTANTPDSHLTFTYDALNRVISKDNVGTPGVSQVVLNYTYGPGTKDRLTDTLGGQIEWEYDNAGRVSQIRQTGSSVDKTVSFTYNATGKISLIDRGGGGRPNTVATYDSLNRLASLTHGSTANYSYQYDNVGNIIQITDSEGQHAYTYDSRDRLLTADHPAASALPDENYTMDAMGNRISSHIHDNDYQTSTGNRLATDGVFNYTYDACGNLTLRTEIGTSNELRMSYDHHNDLVRAEKIVGGSIISTSLYKYDAFDNMISQNVDGDTRILFYDSSNLLLVTNASGNERERYLHAPGRQKSNLWLAEEVGGVVRWYLSDHVDTVRDVVNNTGSLLNHLSIDTYGRILLQSSPSDEPHFIFWGKQTDDFLNFSMAFVSEYDPTVARLIQEKMNYGDGANDYLPFGHPLGQSVSFIDIGIGVNPSDARGGAETRCNPSTGIYEWVYNNNTACDRSCTIAHENNHITHFGPCCKKLSVKYNACTTQACRNAEVRKWNNWFSSGALAYGECSAYKAGRRCRKLQQVVRLCFLCPFKPPNGWAQCCKDLKDGISRDDSQIASNCGGSNPPCPF